jgi:hypothetical protein
MEGTTLVEVLEPTFSQQRRRATTVDDRQTHVELDRRHAAPSERARPHLATVEVETIIHAGCAHGSLTVCLLNSSGVCRAGDDSDGNATVRCQPRIRLTWLLLY